jgi:hypothetical protein
MANKKTPGPEPERLEIHESDWEHALKKALRKRDRNERKDERVVDASDADKPRGEDVGDD